MDDEISSSETRYFTFEWEFLAIFDATKKWKSIINEIHTTVFTDHKPLIDAFYGDKNRNSNKKQRYLSIISVFYYGHSSHFW